jgi:hypothetical protein
MPVKYTIENGLLILDLSGDYETQDLIQTFLAAMKDPACPHEVGLLIDVSQSDSFAARPAGEIRMAAEFIGPYAQRVRSRVAVVATKDVHFGLSQMGAVYSRGVGVDARVFRTRDEAAEWLRAGIPSSR